MQEPSQAWPWHPHSTSTLVVDPMQRRMMHGKVMVWPRWDPRASSHEGVEPSDTAGLGLLGFRATKPPTSLTQRCGCPKLMASAAACCLLLLFFRFRLTEEKKFLLFGGRAVGAQQQGKEILLCTQTSTSSMVTKPQSCVKFPQIESLMAERR